jgi:hypothetical protein
MSDYAIYGRFQLATGKKKQLRDRRFKRDGFDVMLVEAGQHSPDIESYVVEPFLRTHILGTKLNPQSDLTVHEALSAWELLAEIQRLDFWRYSASVANVIDDESDFDLEVARNDQFGECGEVVARERGAYAGTRAQIPSRGPST